MADLSSGRAQRAERARAMRESGVPFKDIAQELGVSCERARQLAIRGRRDGELCERDPAYVLRSLSGGAWDCLRALGFDTDDEVRQALQAGRFTWGTDRQNRWGRAYGLLLDGKAANGIGKITLRKICFALGVDEPEGSRSPGRSPRPLSPATAETYARALRRAGWTVEPPKAEER